MRSKIRLALAAIGLCAAMAPGPAAMAADKVIAGTLGGQAPLWPFHIAVNKGFFAADGIDLELNFIQSGAAVTQQLTAGSLNVALSVGITDPMHAADKGAQVALIRIIGQSAPYVLIGKPGLKTIADLKGKTISVGQVNDITTVYFERMMAANGLKKGEYDMIAAGVSAARFAALKAGVADAALVLPPLNFQANRAGFPTLGFAADYVKDLPFTGMAVFKPWASTHVEVVKRILAVTDKSMAWFADPAHRNEAIDILVKNAHSSREDAEASYEFIRKIDYFEPSSQTSRKKLENVMAADKSVGNLSKAITVDRVVMPGVTVLTD
jgi:ABC-type nitrate/sulfonate/bicarbonate transport system substrate-binding protein